MASIVSATLDRFLQPHRQSFFLFGPRGTGKSVWAARTFAQAHLIDLLRPEVLHPYLARPDRLLDVVAGLADGATVIIDEVQKNPELLPVVHAIIEQKRGIRFVLTGSSARKLKKTGVDLLGGRAGLATLHPFMAAELGSAFTLERALRHGLLPVVWGSEDPDATLAGYVGLYVEQEVKAEGLTRNIGGFARFLQSISFSQSAELVATAVAADCSVGRKAVEGYVEVLDDLLLSFRVQPFSKRSKRSTVKHRKFYFVDSGVYRSLRPAGPLDRPEEIDGAALEGLVAQHLRAYLSYRGGRDELFFWRTHTGMEVDFVVYGKDHFTAIEVKNAGRVRPEDLRGLKAFMDEFPQCTAILLYRGSERLKTKGVLVLPVEPFLRNLHPLAGLEVAVGSS